MTLAQLQTLKADIAADPTLGQLAHTPDNAFAVAAAYSQPASPAYTVWKTRVTITEVGDNFVATELAGLTALNSDRLRTIAVYSPDGVNPSLADRRAFFDDVFSGAGGNATRPRLLALWKRTASRLEKLFAAGTGTVNSPATLTIEGTLSIQDVQDAWSS
jgi:hypothetical protein